VEREYINPPELYQHPSFTRIVTVKGPCRFIFIAGQTPSDKNYEAVFPSDYKAQYLKVIENLSIQLKAAGATWSDVVYRRTFTLDMDTHINMLKDPTINIDGHRVATTGSTLIGVTRLSRPGFLIEMDLMAITES
jgi:enamine deaminase RidA (YjgF/YER057c/UK114 family)